MPAPTALQTAQPRLEDVDEGKLQSQTSQAADDVPLLEPATDDSSMHVDTEGTTDMQIDPDGRPQFAPASEPPQSFFSETRKVPIPPHRFTPLKSTWSKIYPPLVNHLKLQVRMNTKSRCVELRTSKHTTDPGALQVPPFL